MINHFFYLVIACSHRIQNLLEVVLIPGEVQVFVLMVFQCPSCFIPLLMNSNHQIQRDWSHIKS